MKTEQIRYFVKIAQTGSITRAAELLHISQPALSVALTELEDDLGIKLFNRSRSGTALTEAGIRLLPEAEKILAAWQNFQSLAMGEKETENTAISIGVVPSLCFSFLPHVLEIFKNRYPRVRINMVTGGSSRILKDVNEGKVVAGFLSWLKATPFPENRYVMSKLFESSVAILANGAFMREIGKTEITLGDISHLPLFTFTPDYDAYNRINVKIRFLFPKVSLTFVENYHLLFELCSRGLGIGFCPSLLAYNNDYLKQGKLKIIKIREFGIDRDVAAIYLKNSPVSPPLRHLINLALETALDWK